MEKKQGDDAANNGNDTVVLSPHRLQLELRTHPVRGRGVFPKERIKRNTLIEISPVLLFSPDEYKEHGQHTVLDHYTYIWEGGQFALALGLGSMFNHNTNPNVGYYRDFKNKVIRYTTTRDIEIDEEMCISYGSNLWFEDTEEQVESDLDEQDWLGSFDLD
ncbi:hypothetical protein BDB00DRAFT_757073 [Zychaea mexicana]|uniref:uncharacterized protein n=1 Tax=Zychaea mexicana TaxID=64656 RepID=UPI0022FDC2F4|nr:uncharacterized protein BDB00DRAFT_757073 [Zychaea mexicana]KAI9497328.1 hypothetical protein BDB00DRAFT_757073 [Zychaea mexicana]